MFSFLMLYPSWWKHHRIGLQKSRKLLHAFSEIGNFGSKSRPIFQMGVQLLEYNPKINPMIIYFIEERPEASVFNFDNVKGARLVIFWEPPLSHILIGLKITDEITKTKSRYMTMTLEMWLSLTGKINKTNDDCSW